ncbi:hypothetical protein GCM10028791_39130 [Echinicola sediminis]
MPITINSYLEVLGNLNKNKRIKNFSVKEKHKIENIMLFIVVIII